MVIQGVIRPPPEIRAVADRTALYVAKNGRAFEAKILGSEKGKTPKFAFLHTNSPFHAYYEDRIQFYQNGGEDKTESEEKQIAQAVKKEQKSIEDAKGVEEKKTAKTESTKKASYIDPVGMALLSQRLKIVKIRQAHNDAMKHAESEDQNISATQPFIPSPPPIQFATIVAPSAVSVAQLELMQLVAQFAALDGKGGLFLHQLTMREWTNPSYAFCQPRHSHFAYFSALVDAYRIVLSVWTNPRHAERSEIKQMANNVDRCLEVAAYRVEFARDKQEQARKDDDSGAIPSVAVIDWHDFVVVETIDFPADEDVEISLLPPPPPPSSLQPSTYGAKIEPNAGDMDESDEEDENIRVVPTYTPKVVSSDAGKHDAYIDPISGKSVPVKDMPEHMRIQLLDPKWAEERKKFQEKQKESNLVSGDVIASNLERFAQARGDTLRSKEHDLLSKESDPKRRLEEANRVIREQAKSAMVGPYLPTNERRDRLPPEHPSFQPTDFAVEPVAKRPKMENANGSRPLAAPIAKTDSSILMKTNLPPPVPATIEDPFAVAAAAAAAVAGSGTAALAASTGGQDLIAEQVFAASLPKPDITLQIRIPNDRSQISWNFYGQIISISVNVFSTVKAVKEEVSKLHLNNIPPNKIQLKNASSGAFLKDANTLAALNIGPTGTLELVPRARGGRKA